MVSKDRAVKVRSKLKLHRLKPMVSKDRAGKVRSKLKLHRLKPMVSKDRVGKVRSKLKLHRLKPDGIKCSLDAEVHLPTDDAFLLSLLVLYGDFQRVVVWSQRKKPNHASSDNSRRRCASPPSRYRPNRSGEDCFVPLQYPRPHLEFRLLRLLINLWVVDDKRVRELAVSRKPSLRRSAARARCINN